MVCIKIKYFFPFFHSYNAKKNNKRFISKKIEILLIFVWFFQKKTLSLHRVFHGIRLLRL